MQGQSTLKVVLGWVVILVLACCPTAKIDKNIHVPYVDRHKLESNKALRTFETSPQSFREQQALVY